jgi:hypothetical protein
MRDLFRLRSALQEGALGTLTPSAAGAYKFFTFNKRKISLIFHEEDSKILIPKLCKQEC